MLTSTSTCGDAPRSVRMASATDAVARDVHLDRQRLAAQTLEIGGGGLELASGPAGDRDERVGAGERAGDRAADPAAAAGDE